MRRLSLLSACVGLAAVSPGLPAHAQSLRSAAAPSAQAGLRYLTWPGKAAPAVESAPRQVPPLSQAPARYQRPRPQAVPMRAAPTGAGRLGLIPLPDQPEAAAMPPASQAAQTQDQAASQSSSQASIQAYRAPGPAASVPSPRPPAAIPTYAVTRAQGGQGYQVQRTDAAPAQPAPAIDQAATDPNAPSPNAAVYRVAALRATERAATERAAGAPAPAQVQAPAQGQTAPAANRPAAAQPTPMQVADARPGQSIETPGRNPARFYSVHRQAGLQPDPVEINGHYVAGAPITDLAEPPPAPSYVSDRPGTSRMEVPVPDQDGQ